MKFEFSIKMYPQRQKQSSWETIFDNFTPSAIFPPSAIFSAFGADVPVDGSARCLCAPKRAQSTTFAKLSKAKLRA